MLLDQEAGSTSQQLPRILKFATQLLLDFGARWYVLRILTVTCEYFVSIVLLSSTRYMFSTSLRQSQSSFKVQRHSSANQMFLVLGSFSTSGPASLWYHMINMGPSAVAINPPSTYPYPLLCVLRKVFGPQHAHTYILHRCLCTYVPGMLLLAHIYMPGTRCRCHHQGSSCR